MNLLIKNMDTIKISLDRPIAFYAQLARALGGIEEAIFVQQLYYWSSKVKDPEGWLYKSKIDWEIETTLTPKQQDRIVRRLKGLKIVITKLKSVKNRPTLHYKLDNALLQKVIMQYDERDECNMTKGTILPTEITTETTTDIIAAPAAEPLKNKKADPATPMNLQEFIVWCKKSPQRHIQIIADYADQKKANFITRGQWDEFIVRNLRAARSLAHYTDEQIEKAVKEILEAEKDYLEKWTLETVSKFLTT